MAEIHTQQSGRTRDLIKSTRRAMGVPDQLPEDKHPDLILGAREDVLREAWRRRDAGASLEAIRRDTGTVGVHDLDNRTLEAALENGRRLEQFHETGRITERARYFGGIPRLPTKAEYEAQLAVQCVQPTDGMGAGHEEGI